MFYFCLTVNSRRIIALHDNLFLGEICTFGGAYKSSCVVTSEVKDCESGTDLMPKRHGAAECAERLLGHVGHVHLRGYRRLEPGESCGERLPAFSCIAETHSGSLPGTRYLQRHLQRHLLRGSTGRSWRSAGCGCAWDPADPLDESYVQGLRPGSEGPSRVAFQAIIAERETGSTKLIGAPNANQHWGPVVERVSCVDESL